MGFGNWDLKPKYINVADGGDQIVTKSKTRYWGMVIAAGEELAGGALYDGAISEPNRRIIHKFLAQAGRTKVIKLPSGVTVKYQLMLIGMAGSGKITVWHGYQ